MFCLCLSLVALCLSQPIVKTNYGPIQGLDMSDPVRNLKYRRFQGVPFATPPLGLLRWKNPTPPGSWGPEPLNCTFFDIGCAQRAHSLDVPKNKSEDCLYLEIFAPPENKFESSASVLIWMYGGDWHEGGESFKIYNGAYLASELNTVVVALNYRLEALGFLFPPSQSWGDPNVGLEDQRMAFKWVFENAKAFGANSSKIAIAGQSAGGESVLIHVSNPENPAAKYFSRAIVESGPISMNFKMIPEAKTLSQSYAIALNCSDFTQECASSKTTEEVLKASQVINIPFSWSDLIQQWAPVVTNSTSFKMQPIEAFEKGLITPYPIISGSNQDDSKLFAYALTDKKMPSVEYVALVYGVFNKNISRVPEILDLYPPSIFGDNRPVLTELLTDYIFYCSARYSLMKASKLVPTFSYVFSRVYPFCFWPKNQQYCCNASCHGDEIPFVFMDANGTFPWTFSEIDLNLATQMSIYWSAFSHTGVPGVGWPQFENSTLLNINFNNTIHVQKEYRKEYCDLLDTFGYDMERSGP